MATSSTLHLDREGLSRGGGSGMLSGPSETRSPARANAALSPSLADQLVAQERDLAAAPQFARWHEGHAAPALASHYRTLIPLTRPRPGEQYGFEVDLDRCSGCKACVSACHSLNGLDDGEAWRDIGLLVSTDWRHPFQQTVTTACHHCVDPACLNGCPVLAYDKDPVTGIVRHLDDQCIGCQYCILKCPYDVPKYSPARGIVRKCDLCRGRLAANEAPACVQACPNEAIRITVVNTTALAASLRAKPRLARGLLPGAPASAYTLPTTRFRSLKPLPRALQPADHEQLRPQPPHTALVLLLILSQLAVGLSGGAAAVGWQPPSPTATWVSRWLAVAAVGSGLLGLGASLLHLGQPWGAWRAFLGLRRSWLSREIVALGLFLGLSGGHAAALWRANGPRLTVACLRATHRQTAGWGTGAFLAGALFLFCSAMVYHDTGREFWRRGWTLPKFLASSVLLGLAGTLAALAAAPAPAPARWFTGAAGLLMLVAFFKLGLEQRVLRHLPDDDFRPLHKTALLLTGALGVQLRIRLTCLLLGAVVLPGLLILRLAGHPPAPGLGASRPDVGWLTGLAFAGALAGETLERRLFFLAVQPSRMPGPLPS